MNEFNTIHETVIRDVVDTIKDGVEATEKISGKGGYTGSIASAGSLSKATSGLTLTFPVLVDNSIPVETANMISKAVETKAVSMLQIAFSAFNVSNSKDALEFIRNFHTNISGGKLSLDDVIDTMDSLVDESSSITPEVKSQYRAIKEDMMKYCNFTFEENVSESSLNDFKIITRGMSESIITEGHPRQDAQTLEDNLKENRLDRESREAEGDKNRFNSRAVAKMNIDADKKKWDADYAEKVARNNVQNAKDRFEMLKTQILPGDIKKANEMTPTMMIVNFLTTDTDVNAVVTRQLVIGVKARLIAVDPEDVGNKLITKHADGNLLLKLIKAKTREISFIKDFLFAIDNAKINAVSTSKKGSNTYKYLRLLERRALNGKIRKALKLNNFYKAISTLVLSKELVENIKRYNNIDMEKADVARPIMEKLNLMMLIIADESEECVKIIMDTGDDTYETISYTHLERDTSDKSMKKVVNLMASNR